MTPPLDLLADASDVRAEVRTLLAGWTVDALPAVQQSAPGYPETRWEAFRRQLGSRLHEPQVVRIVLEEVGAARCPLPLHAGLVQPLAACAQLGPAGAALRERLLRRGESFAWASPVAVAAEREGGGWRLSGRTRHFSYGDSPDFLLVVGRHEPGAVVAVVPAGAPGVRRSTRATMSHDRLTEAEFDRVALPPEAVLDAGPEVGAAAQRAGTLAVAAELVGMSAALLTAAAARVTSRHAFGAPLAALQSVQMRAADLYLDFVAARDAVVEASTIGSALHVSAAKVTATQSALAIAAGAHQLCGGWGLLEAAGLHHYTRAIKAAESRLGSPREHRAIIAEYLRA